MSTTAKPVPLNSDLWNLLLELASRFLTVEADTTSLSSHRHRYVFGVVRECVLKYFPMAQSASSFNQACLQHNHSSRSEGHCFSCVFEHNNGLFPFNHFLCTLQAKLCDSDHNAKSVELLNELLRHFRTSLALSSR
jgi:hypothetical protein